MTNAEKYLKDGVDTEEFIDELYCFWWADEYDVCEGIRKFLSVEAKKKTPKLTEDEKVILKNIDKKFKSIKRAKNNANDSYLYLVMEDNAFRDIRYEFEVFPNLFQFIKERRRI